MVDCERTTGPLPQPRPLVRELGWIAEGGPDAAERSRFADRGGEINLFPGAELCADERHFDAQEVAQQSTQHGHGGLYLCQLNVSSASSIRRAPAAHARRPAGSRSRGHPRVANRPSVTTAAARPIQR